MTGKFTADLRTPVRGAAAALIALYVGNITGLPRPYWAVLVAVLMISGTWGENIRRSLSRLGMTAMGSLVAVALFVLIHGYHNVEIAVMLASIFLAAYFRNGSYPLMVFFITVYVVFLYALLGRSVPDIIPVRVYQTGIGCAVAIAASLLIPPQRSRRQWDQQIDWFWLACQKQIAAAFNRLLQPAEDVANNPSAGRELQQALITLRDRHKASYYEGLFFTSPHKRRAALMDKARLLAHFAMILSGSVDLLRSAKMSELLGPALTRLRDYTLLQLDTIAPDAPKHPEPSLGELDRIQESIYKQAIQLEKAGRISRADIVAIGPVVYSAREISQIVNDVRSA